MTLDILLPKPNVDVHTFEGNLNVDENSSDKSIYVKYVTDISRYTLLASGKVKIYKYIFEEQIYIEVLPI